MLQRHSGSIKNTDALQWQSNGNVDPESAVKAAAPVITAFSPYQRKGTFIWQICSDKRLPADNGLNLDLQWIISAICLSQGISKHDTVNLEITH
jgi:hypothetical protein